MQDEDTRITVARLDGFLDAAALVKGPAQQYRYAAYTVSDDGRSVMDVLIERYGQESEQSFGQLEIIPDWPTPLGQKLHHIIGCRYDSSLSAQLTVLADSFLTMILELVDAQRCSEIYQTALTISETYRHWHGILFILPMTQGFLVIELLQLDLKVPSGTGMH